MPIRPPTHRPAHWREPTNRRKEADANRENSYQRGYGRRWRAAREDFLKKNPLCAECTRQGFTTAATVVDHIIPHRGDKELFWRRSNWQSLCKTHHDEKTARGE